METAAHIEKALTILKKWNPTWHPKFIMCDYSEAEIMSMESAFPSTTVYIYVIFTGSNVGRGGSRITNMKQKVLNFLTSFVTVHGLHHHVPRTSLKTPCTILL